MRAVYGLGMRQATERQKPGTGSSRTVRRNADFSGPCRLSLGFSVESRSVHLAMRRGKWQVQCRAKRNCKETVRGGKERERDLFGHAVLKIVEVVVGLADGAKMCMRWV
jgi:hypothetical protein